MTENGSEKSFTAPDRDRYFEDYQAGTVHVLGEVRADVDEEAVYQITKAMYENLPFLHNIHKATHAISLESALSGLPVPLHSGAARFYQESGLEIPGALLGG